MNRERIISQLNVIIRDFHDESIPIEIRLKIIEDFLEELKYTLSL